MPEMFDILIDKQKIIRVIENGNLHEIPLLMTYWGDNDLLSHWALEIYELLDRYSLKYLFLNMTEDKGQGYIRVFRAVRTRNRIHFDDIRTAVPWRIQSWNPMECIEYALSERGSSRIDYAFRDPDRIHEFSVSIEELSVYLNNKLEKRIPEDYESNYKLYYASENT